MSNIGEPTEGDAVPSNQQTGVGGEVKVSGCMTAIGLTILLAGLGMFVLYGAAELDQACKPDPYSTGFCGADSFVLGAAWVLVVFGLVVLIGVSMGRDKKDR